MKYRVILTKLSFTIVISYTRLREKYEISKKSEWKIYKNIAKEKEQIFIYTYHVLYEKIILMPENTSL